MSGITFGRVVYAELIKFRSLRSTWITYLVALIIGIGLGLSASGFGGADFHNHPNQGDFDPVGQSIGGFMLAQLAVGVLGVMFATGEYATGSIRASVAAVPRRTPILTAKALVLGSVTAMVALAMLLIAFFGGQAIMSTWGLDVTLSHPGALRALLGAVLYLVCVALIGLGIGFALRNTGGSIATLLGILLILPLLLNALPQSWRDQVAKFLPLNIVEELAFSTNASSSTTALSPAVGAVMLVVYALAALALGLFVFKRRDA